MIDKTTPAFPTLDYLRPDRVATNQNGMPLRDYFAAKAMQGMLSRSESDDWTNEDIATAAYTQANAMMEARK